LQKFPDSVTYWNTGKLSFLTIVLFIFFLPVDHAGAQIIRKSKVTFLAADSLLITADHYYSRKDYPYILLFHTEKASRGEFDSIATRFARMKYNCLAVDMRSGENFGYVDNETAKRARSRGYSTTLSEGLNDIKAAIAYAVKLSGQPVVLLGSSSSASLCLLAASDNPQVKAVMAFSPGEFFKPELEITELAANISKPVFVTCSDSEVTWIKEMFAETDDKYLDLFLPSGQVNERGTDLLTPKNAERDQYWLAVLIFIKSL